MGGGGGGGGGGGRRRTRSELCTSKDVITRWGRRRRLGGTAVTKVGVGR